MSGHVVSLNTDTSTLHEYLCTMAEIQVGQGGNRPPPPPSINRHSLSEILGSVGISKQLNIPKLIEKITGA